MPAVLVTGPTVTQNSPIPANQSLGVSVIGLIAISALGE